MITKTDLIDMYGDNIYYIEDRKPEAFIMLCGKKIGVNAGDFGWNWSAFDIGHEICILDGYRNFIGKPLPEKLTERFEKRAIKLFKDLSMPYFSRQKKACSLALEFCERIRK